jgi:hypothetical protein
MRSANCVGRIVGLALLVQLLVALPVYFVWMRPVTGSGFLENAAGSALQIRLALLVTFVLGAMTFTAAIMAMPVFRRYSERLALAFLAMSIVGLATLAMESMSMRNMLSLSLEYAKPGAANDLLRTLGGLARSTAVGAHHTNLSVAHGTVLLLYIILYRFALVPRALAAFGMAASLLSTTAVTMPLLGYRLVFQLVMPAAIGNLALMLWLIVRGFEERQHRSRGDAAPVDGLPEGAQ